MLMVSKVFTGSVKLNKPGGRVALLPEPPESIYLGMMQEKDRIFFTVVRLQLSMMEKCDQLVLLPLGAVNVRKSPRTNWGIALCAPLSNILKNDT
jgi:hypothetical protein